jgi:hypothetical protein
MKFYKTKIAAGTQTSFSTNFGGGKLSVIPSFLTASIASTYIEPCALNAEFRHFTLRFNKISLLCNTAEKGHKV